MEGQMEKSRFSNEKSTASENGFEDPNITDFFLHKYSALIEDNLSIEEVNPPLMFSDFINCILMAVHIKSGSIKRLSTHLSNYMKKRFLPIMNKQLRPKILIGDQAVILRRGKAVLQANEDHWRGKIKEIWSILQSIPGSNNAMTAGSLTAIAEESPDKKSMKESSLAIPMEGEGSKVQHCTHRSNSKKLFGGLGSYKSGIDVKTFLDTMIDAKQIKYDTIEEKKLLWMTFERNEDPEESLFRLLMKIEKRKGKTHSQIEQRILKWIRIKL